MKNAFSICRGGWHRAVSALQAIGMAAVAALLMVTGPSAASDWTGPYAGVSIDTFAASDMKHASVYDRGERIWTETIEGSDRIGVFGGFAGYDQEIGTNFVLGGEVGMSHSQFDSEDSRFSVDSANYIRVRLGIFSNTAKNVMLYGHLGFTNIEISGHQRADIVNSGPCEPGDCTGSGTKFIGTDPPYHVFETSDIVEIISSDISNDGKSIGIVASDGGKATLPLKPDPAVAINDYQYGIGVEVRPTDKWSVRAEYTIIDIENDLFDDPTRFSVGLVRRF